MNDQFRITTTQSILLNLIRFLCSQGVLAGHLFYFFQVQNEQYGGLASYCVLLFFILSGFLISHSLSSHLRRDPSYSFSDFFRDRFFRIYPPFLAALVVVFLIDLIGFGITGQYYSLKMYFGNFLINALQLQEFPLATYLNEHYMIEFFRFHYFGTDLPLWTISIEWWLYLFYGFIVFHFAKKKTFGIAFWVLLGLLSVTPVYYMLVSGRMERGLTLYWFLGTLITMAAFQKTSFKFSSGLFAMNLLLLLTGMYGFPLLGYHTSALVFFLSLMLMIAYGRDEFPRLNAAFKGISEKLAGYSYSLYLIHYSLLYFIMTVFHVEYNLFHFILVFVIVNIIAYFFAEVFEKKSKQLKLKYENYRSGKY